MGTKNVCYNYLRYASWLDFIRIEGTVVSRNAYTVLLSTLESSGQFYLSDKEKFAYFIHLWAKAPELGWVLRGLSSSNPLPSGKLQSKEITEHSAETFLEWFVDLDLVNGTKRKFGAFVLTPMGEHVKSESDTVEQACCAYAGYILGKHVKLDENISRRYLWRQTLTLARQLSPHIRSPVDPKLVSALPILLHLQIQILNEKAILIPLERLIRLVEDATDRSVAIFTWDHAYSSGFLKFR
jgi:hypothetical protein